MASKLMPLPFFLDMGSSSCDAKGCLPPVTVTMDKPMEFGVKINDKTSKSQDDVRDRHLSSLKVTKGTPVKIRAKNQRISVNLDPGRLK